RTDDAVAREPLARDASEAYRAGRLVQSGVEPDGLDRRAEAAAGRAHLRASAAVGLQLGAVRRVHVEYGVDSLRADGLLPRRDRAFNRGGRLSPQSSLSGCRRCGSLPAPWRR